MYGLYVAILAFASYGSQLDLGTTTVFGNRACLAARNGKTKKQARCLEIAYLIPSTLLVTVITIYAATTFILPDGSIATNIRVFLLIIISCLVGVFSTACELTLRAWDRYSSGVFLNHTTRLIESLTLVCAAILLEYSMTAAVMAATLLKALLPAIWVALNFFKLKALLVALKPSKSIHRLKRYFRQTSLGTQCLSLSSTGLLQNLQTQIPIVTLTLFGATAAVAIYSTAKTFSRSIIQITQIFAHSLIPKILTLSTPDNLLHLQKLKTSYERKMLFLLVITVPPICTVTPWIVSFWTNGAVQVSLYFATAIILQSAIQSTWLVSKTLAQTLNQHLLIARSVLAGCIVFAVTAPIMNFTHGLTGLAIAGIAGEFATAVIFRKKLAKSLKSPQRSFN